MISSMEYFSLVVCVLLLLSHYGESRGLENEIEIVKENRDKYKFVNIDHTHKTITLLYEREWNRGGVTMSILHFTQYIEERDLTQYKVYSVDNEA